MRFTVVESLASYAAPDFVVRSDGWSREWNWLQVETEAEDSMVYGAFLG